MRSTTEKESNTWLKLWKAASLLLVAFMLTYLLIRLLSSGGISIWEIIIAALLCIGLSLALLALGKILIWASSLFGSLRAVSSKTLEKTHRIGEGFSISIREAINTHGSDVATKEQIYGYLHAIEAEDLPSFAANDKESQLAFIQLLNGLGYAITSNYKNALAKYELASSMTNEARDRNSDIGMFLHGFMAGYHAGLIDIDDFENNLYLSFSTKRLNELLN